MFTNFPESRQDRLDSLGSERGKNNKGRMLLVHLRRSGSSPPGNAAHPHARFPHVGRWKRWPRTAEEDCPPSCGNRPARPGKGNAGPSSYRSVVRINYMDNSLGKVKKAHRTRAVIMHSNSQQLTVDRLFREPSIETCGT